VSWLPGTPELAPAAYERFRALYDGLWRGGMDAGVLELCRARIGALVRAERSPIDWSELDDAQRAALAFAEQYVLDPHGLRDSDFAALHAHFEPPEIATLVLAVAMFDARSRFECALEVS